MGSPARFRAPEARQKQLRRNTWLRWRPILAATFVLLFGLGVFLVSFAYGQSVLESQYVTVREQAAKVVAVLDSGRNLWPQLRPLLSANLVTNNRLRLVLLAWGYHNVVIGYQPVRSAAYPSVFFHGANHALVQTFWLYEQSTRVGGERLTAPMMQVLLLGFSRVDGQWLVSSINTQLIAGYSSLPTKNPEQISVSK